MAETRTFYPPKQVGTAFQLALILFFSGAGAWGIWGVSRVQVALELLPYLALIALFLVAVPFLIYRLYALHRSEYILDRGGIHLQWGWRSETIAIDRVKWVHAMADLEVPPQLPLLRWPGSVLGRRRFQRGPVVEFLASRSRKLVVISAGEGYYALSPADPDEFITTFNYLTELGALSHLQSQSFHPSLMLTEISGSRPLLGILLAGAVLNVTLLIWVLQVIPDLERLSMGFNPAGLPREALGSARLILFPIINTTAYLANLIMGLFLYRNSRNRRLAYLLWGGSLLIGIIFHIGMLFILS